MAFLNCLSLNQSNPLLFHSFHFFLLIHPIAGNAHYELLITEDYESGELKLSDFIGRAMIIHERLDYGNTPSCPNSEK